MTETGKEAGAGVNLVVGESSPEEAVGCATWRTAAEDPAWDTQEWALGTTGKPQPGPPQGRSASWADSVQEEKKTLPSSSFESDTFRHS